MRIKDIHISGFGVFNSLEIRDLPPGLSLFLGDNEAGKSTLLAFIRAMLFGFPAKKKSDERNKYPPLHGGKYGGSLSVCTADGRVLIANRVFEGKQKPAHIADEKGRVQKEDALEAVLGGTTRELFKSIYAFSLSELQNFETLDSEQVRAVLYGAAMGAGILALPRAQDFLTRRQKELFLPAGEKPAINRKLEELDGVRGEIRAIKDSVSLYDDLQSRIKLLDQQIRSEQTRVERKSERLSHIDKLVTHHGEWLALEELYAELQSIPEELATFAPESLQGLEQEKSQLEVYENQVEDARRKHESATDNLASLAPGSIITGFSEEISELRADQNRAGQAFEGITSLVTQVEEDRERLAAMLAQMGAGWDIARVRSIADSDMDPDAIMKYQSSFSEIEARKAAGESRKVECKKALAEKTQILEQLQQQLDELGPQVFFPEKETVNAVRSGVEKFSGDCRQAGRRRADSNAYKARIRQNFATLSQTLGAAKKAECLCDLFQLDDVLAEGRARQCIKANLDTLTRGNISEWRDEYLKSQNAVANARGHLLDKQSALDDIIERLRIVDDSLAALVMPDDAVDDTVVDMVRMEQARLEMAARELNGANRNLADKEAELETLRRSANLFLNYHQIRSLDVPVIRVRLAERDAALRELDGQLSEVNGSERELSAIIAGLEKSVHEIDKKIEALGIDDSLTNDQLDAPLAALQKLGAAMPERDRLSSDLRHARERLEDKRRAEAVLEQSAAVQSSRQIRTLTLIIAVVGLVCAGLLAAFVNIYVGAVLAAALLAAASWLAWRKFGLIGGQGQKTLSNLDSLRKEIAELNQNILSLEADVEKQQTLVVSLADTAGVGPDCDAAALEVARSGIYATERLIKERDRLRSDLDVLHMDLDPKLPVREELLQQKSGLLKQRADAQSAWIQYLSGFGIDAPTVVGGDSEVLARIEKIQSQLDLLENMTTERNAFQSAINESLAKLSEIPQLSHITSLALSDAIGRLGPWLALSGETQTLGRKREVKLAQLKTLAEDRARAEQELAAAQEMLNKAEQQQETSKRAWQEWAVENLLPGDCSYADAIAAVEILHKLSADLISLAKVHDESAQLEESLNRYRDLIASVPELAGFARADAEVVEQQLKEFFARTEKEDNLRQQHTLAARDIESATRAYDQAQSALNEAGSQILKALADETEALNNWRSWLIEHNLDSSLEPLAASNLLRDIRQCADIERQATSRAGRLESAREELDIYISRARKVAGALGRAILDAPAIFAQIGELSKELTLEQERASARVEAEKKVAEFAESLAEAIEARDLSLERIKETLAAASCADEEELLSKTRASAHRKSLQQDIAARERSLRRIFDWRANGNTGINAGKTAACLASGDDLSQEYGESGGSDFSLPGQEPAFANRETASPVALSKRAGLPSAENGEPGSGAPGNGAQGNGEPGNGEPGNGEQGNGASDEDIVSLDCLRERYRDFDIDCVRKERADLLDEIARLKEKVDGSSLADMDAAGSGLRYELSSLIAERDRIAKSDELRQLHAREECLLAELSHLAAAWSRVTIAKHLLERAKKRFERDGQPAVVELASHYFSTITGGAYTGMIAGSDGQSGKIEVQNSKRQSISADVLSTGTQEQLYLALRFGFIRHRAETSEPLPIIMDDILVNFDPGRAGNAAVAIRELSEKHQILLFTCHPSTVEQFRAFDSEVRVFTLESGRIVS